MLGASVRVPGAIDFAVGYRSLWVVGFGAVSRINPTNGRVVATIKTPNTAGSPTSQIAVGDRGVWVTATGREGVYRIDPATDRIIARVHFPGVASGVAVGGGEAWVTVIPPAGPGVLVRIDPRTDRVVGAPLKIGPGPGRVIYWRGAVWVEDTSPFSLLRVDPASRSVTTAVGTSAVQPGDFAVGSIGVGFGSLWVASNDSLTRIDPRTLQATATVGVPRADLIAFAASAVWVFSDPKSKSPTLYFPIKGAGRLWQIDPCTNKLVGRHVALGALQPIALAATPNSLWVADYNSKTVTRVRLVRGRHHAT